MKTGRPRKDSDDRREVMTLSLPGKLKRKVDAICKKEGRSKSEIGYELFSMYVSAVPNSYWESRV